MWPKGRLLRLNVSDRTTLGKECVRIKSNGEVTLFVERDALGQEERRAIKQQCKDITIEPWETESQRRDCTIVPRSCSQHLPVVYELARDANDAMIERYTQWTLNDQYKEAHSHGLTAFVREYLGNSGICDPDDSKPTDNRTVTPKQFSLFDQAEDSCPTEPDSPESDEVQEALVSAAERAGKALPG